jgi:hypothetical protein
MSVRTDTAIQAWQEHAGLTPASPREWDDLERLQSLAFDLIKVIELEKSGIRQGDGNWYGGDPIRDIIREMDAFNRQAMDAIGTSPLSF